VPVTQAVAARRQGADESAGRRHGRRPRRPYGAGFEKNLEINGSSSGWGGPLYRGSRTGSARTEEVVTGTPVVAMADPETKSIIWRGVASKDLDANASPEKRDKGVNKAVAKMFEKYPRKQK